MFGAPGGGVQEEFKQGRRGKMGSGDSGNYQNLLLIQSGVEDWVNMRPDS